jgi:hypothetical protein
MTGDDSMVGDEELALWLMSLPAVSKEGTVGPMIKLTIILSAMREPR